MTCQICKTTQHKYKCSKCIIKYCSSACFQAHQCHAATNDSAKRCLNNLNQLSTLNETTNIIEDCITGDRVPEERLHLLKGDEKLMGCLKNRHLRVILSALDVSTDPDGHLIAAMGEPIFAEFVDYCLRVVEQPDNTT